MWYNENNKRRDAAMSGNILIRPAYERDAAALARIYAYYVEKNAERL